MGTPPESQIAYAQRTATSERLQNLTTEFLGYFNSSDTIETYQQTLEQFYNFCSDNDFEPLAPKSLNERMISFYIKSCAQCGNSPATLNLKMNVFSSFFNFLIKKKEVEKNPLLILRKKYRHKTGNSTESLTIDEVSLIISQLESDTKTQVLKRKKDSAKLKEVILKTLLTIGLRVSELCQIRMGDLAFTEGSYTLSYTTKGGTVHCVALPDTLMGDIQSYISEYRKNSTKEAPLFIRTGNHIPEKPLSRVSVWKFVKEVCVKVGIERNISPHSCRATVATWMHQAGVPIKEIQLLLNHKSIETTSIYIKKIQWEENAPLLSKMLEDDTQSAHYN